jgi:hypothetical protein
LSSAPTFRRFLSALLIPGFLSALTPEAQASSYRFLENGNPANRGEDVGFLAETPTRLKIDLAGTWAYAVDDGPSGSVKVPGAYDFVGKVVFRRTIEITSSQIDNYDFHFVMLGSNYNTEVSINGDFITNHAGGYTSFVVPIPPNVLQVGSENAIQVTTDNRLDARKTLPLRPLVWRWRNYGGIHRDVFILGTPKLAVREVQAITDISADHSTATITVLAAVEGNEPEASPEAGQLKKGTVGFMVEIFDKITGSPVAKSSVAPLARQGTEWGPVRAAVTLQNPKLWSPEFPELYLLKCSLVSSGKEKDIRVIDEYDLTYGLRDFVVRDGEFVLNGVRTVLKGVIWQEDHPVWGSAMTYEDLERDVVLIKNLGANTVRFGSHPPHPYMLNLCDRYGLLALQEIPLVDAPASAVMHEEYLEMATTAIREMILRDRNHPSMIAWGIGDQFETSNRAIRPFVESLVRTARSLDSRPTYFTSRMLSSDVCEDLVDIPGIAISTLDAKQFRQQVQEWKSGHPGRPLLIARFGTEVQSGNRNGYSDPLSYEAQARFYIQRFDILKSLGYDGALVSSLNDWKGDRPALTVNSGDPWMHTMGLVSYQREKRLAYEAVRSVFRSEKFVALPIGNYTPSAPIIYVLAGLVVLIGVAYLYNASRRFREALNRSLMNSFNFFADVRDQRIVSVIHSTLLGVIVSVASAIVISSILYHFRGSWVLDNLLSYLLVYDNVKAAAVRLIWHPLQSILYLSMIFFGVLLVAVGAMLTISPLFKARIYPFHAYAITMWSTPPLLALVPLGMILFRLMETSVYVVPSLVIVAGLLVWVVLRLLKGISIIFDVLPARVYFVGVIAIVAVAAFGYLYYDYTQSTSAYLSFMVNAVTGSK